MLWRVLNCSSSASAEAAATLKAGYTCKETQGALLVLQSHGHSETVFSNRKLKIYMVRQHEQWCAYLRDVLGQDISSGEVVLISGWVKTSADWAAAAFSNFVSKHHAAIQAQASQFVGFELFRSRMRAQSGPKMHRQGVKYPRGKGRTLAELERDQSIFLQRYKLKRRLVILKTIVAGAGYDRLPDHGRGGDSGERLHANREESDDSDADDDGLQWLQDKVCRVLRLVSRSLLTPLQIVDPLDILLEYILEVCVLLSLSHMVSERIAFICRFQMRRLLSHVIMTFEAYLGYVYVPHHHAAADDTRDSSTTGLSISPRTSVEYSPLSTWNISVSTDLMHLIGSCSPFRRRHHFTSWVIGSRTGSEHRAPIRHCSGSSTMAPDQLRRGWYSIHGPCQVHGRSRLIAQLPIQVAIPRVP